jgi:hypothetical protein
MTTQYFAQIDANNVVIKIAVVTKEFLDANPDRYEGVWVETFYDTPNKIYAGLGDVYDYETENFIQPVYIPPVIEP